MGVVFSGEACPAPERRKRPAYGSRRGCGRDPPSPLPRHPWRPARL